MTGISEILVLVLLITCILILPRLFKKEPEKKSLPLKKRKRLPAKIRFSIILTLVYPIIMSLYLKPWHEDIIPFLSLGIMPVFLVWGIAWVIAGRKK